MSCKYPEHAKMRMVVNDSQIIGEFLEWLSAQRIELTKLQDNDQYAPIRERTEQIIARYFGIDLKVIEQEKRAMLEEIRGDDG